MSIQITGILLKPTGSVSPKTTIRITAAANGNDILCGAPSIEVTGSDGTYDFPLIEGVFILEVLYSKSYKEGGTVTIDENTPLVLSLPELFDLAI